VPRWSSRRDLQVLRRLDRGLGHHQGVLISVSSPERPSLRRRAARAIARHERLRLGIELSGPLLWLLIVYIGALAALLITMLYRQVSDPTGLLTKLDTTLHLDNLRRVWDTDVYRKTAWRTVQSAAIVTIVDALIALPMAFFMAKVVRRRSVRRLLVVAVVMPLWAGYLVKGYAWRAILDPAGGALHELTGHSPGFGFASTTLVLCYQWFPFMLIPIYAGLDRLPDSLLEASTDLGAKAGRTVWSIILPQLRPAIIAGSIFTFSLTLGDFYMNRIVGGTNEFIGNIIYREFSVDLPFAAAYALVPILIMLVYLIGARSTGALEEL
jgi:putative spermidine/putrescine transport system permease protein